MILLALTLAFAPLQADPLAPARDGRLQCHQPDAARKTCEALAGYAFAADGTILNRSEVLLSSTPVIVMRDEQPVTVRDGAVCGPLGAFDTTEFTIDGQPAPASTADMIRGRVTAAFAVLGREGCTRYSPQGDGWLAEVSIDGRRRTEFDQTVVWVSPADGWSVRP